jgi:hypothetical protein
MKNNITTQPTKPLKLKKERIALLSSQRAPITMGSFSPTATCMC